MFCPSNCRLVAPTHTAIALFRHLWCGTVVASVAETVAAVTAADTEVAAAARALPATAAAAVAVAAVPPPAAVAAADSFSQLLFYLCWIRANLHRVDTNVKSQSLIN